MPEAVDSISTPALEGQPTFDAGFEAFDTTIYELEASAAMLASFLDECCTSTRKQGIPFLFHRQASDLREIYSQLVDYEHALHNAIAVLGRDNEHLRKKADARSDYNTAFMLQFRIWDIVCKAWDEFNGREATKEEEKRLKELAARHCDQIMQSLSIANNPIEAGSLVPFAESEIRAELGKANGLSGPMADRDRLIKELADKGTPTASISQTFNIRRDAVERILGRQAATSSDAQRVEAALEKLTGETDTVSNDVRDKIERAADRA